jgi:hypothetical protein
LRPPGHVISGTEFLGAVEEQQELRSSCGLREVEHGCIIEWKLAADAQECGKQIKLSNIPLGERSGGGVFAVNRGAVGSSLTI